MTNKIILLYSLLAIPYVALGMEEKENEQKKLAAIRNLPIETSVLRHNEDEELSTEKDDFTLHRNRVTKVGLIYQGEKVVERITFDNESHLTTIYSSVFPKIIVHREFEETFKPYFFLTVIKKGGQCKSYKITCVIEAPNLSILDKATKLKKIIIPPADQQEKVVGNPRSDWPALIGAFVCGSVVTTAAIIFWFINNFRYNK